MSTDRTYTLVIDLDEEACAQLEADRSPLTLELGGETFVVKPTSMQLKRELTFGQVVYGVALVEIKADPPTLTDTRGSNQ